MSIMSCASYENTLQIYSILSSIEQELRRICASGVKICSMEVRMCRKISILPSILAIRMKPTKNKIFCLSCRRPKMLFETQAKADNFILYNKDEIEEENGKAPVRSYYCRLCGGWHVTSSQSEEIKARAERREEKIATEADRLVKIHEDVDSVINELYGRWEEAKAAIQQGRLRVAEMSMKKCLGILNSLRISADIPLNWDKWAIHISDLQKKIDRYREFIGQPKKEREALLAKENKTKVEEEICMAYLAYQTLFKIDTLLEEVEKDIERGDKDAVKEKLIECRALVLHEIHCPYKKSLMRDYRNQIKKKCKRAGVSLREEAKPRYLIDEKSMTYNNAILYLIKKFKALQSVYDSGDYYEGMWQLSIIGKGLKELPNNSETEVLGQQYEHWGELFGELEDEDVP